MLYVCYYYVHVNLNCSSELNIHTQTTDQNTPMETILSMVENRSTVHFIHICTAGQIIWLYFFRYENKVQLFR